MTVRVESLGGRLRSQRVAAVLVATLCGVGVIAHAPAAQAAAPVILGFATNFDVSNTTDKECEGFEVEIEDVTPSQITSTWPGNPYGYAQAPVATTFPNGHPGVVIRYKAQYNAGGWNTKTAIGQYNHFGVHVNVGPGVQRYSWLCDLGGSGSGSTGVLTPYGGTTSDNFFTHPGVAAVVPSIVATPTGEVVQAVIVPAVVPQPAEPQFPDAVWVVKYQASTANPVDLAQLLPTDPEVQAAIANSQISSIAELFQPDPGTNQGIETEPADPIEPGDRATVTVTETYPYTGPVDPIDNSVTCNETVGDPNNCSNFVGPMTARQMVAINLGTGVNRATLSVAVKTGPNVASDGGTVTSTGTANASPGEIDCGVSCFASVDAASIVHLTATPNAGYHLQGWAGGCSGASATCNVTVNGLTSVTATFMPDAVTAYVADGASYEGQATKTHALKFNVVLSAVRSASTSVNYSTVDATATAGADYVAKTGSVSIPAGKTSATISITVDGDNAVEGPESFGLAINSVAGAASGTTQATATILDDDTSVTPSVSVGDATLVEGNSGTQLAVFPVTLTAPLAATTPVQYSTQNLSATSGSDYTAKSGTVSIPAGAVSAKISIVVKGDNVAEGTETFKLKVTGTGASGVATDRDNAIGKIIDDDTAATVGVSVGDASVVEGDTGQKSVTLTITLSAPAATTTAVKYHTVDGTAVTDGDATAKAGTVNILAGKTTGVITLVVNGDTEIETDEKLTVVIDSAGTVALARPTGTLTILNDD